MQNLKIKICPLHFSYQSQKPLSIILKYKRILITTNHQLEKYQCKNKFILNHNQLDFDPSTASKEIQLSKEFELMNTKVQLLILQCAQQQNNKWKHQFKLLGVCTIDLGNFESQSQYALSHEACFKQLEVKLDKCDDKDSLLKILLNFQSIKEKEKKRETEIENGILKTQSYYKETLIAKRKTKEVPNAYEISRKNYKNSNVSRFDDPEKSKSSRSSVGSYRKRFQYQDEKNKRKKINHNMTIFPSKKPTNNSPMPRLQTPQPIPSTGKYSNPTAKQMKGKQNIVIEKKVKKIGKKINVISNSQISQYDFEQSEEHVYPQSSFNESNIENVKENKYKIITQKLEAIEKKINKKKYDTPQSEYDEFDEKPRQLVIPQYDDKKSKQKSAQTDMIESDVRHFSPLTSSRREKNHQESQLKMEESRLNESKQVMLEKKGKQTDLIKSVKEYQQKIEEYEQIMEENEEVQRKKVLQLQLQHKIKLQELQDESNELKKENIQLKKENQSKKQIIQKINKLYEEADDRCFQIQKNYEKKSLDYEEKIDGLLRKNSMLEKEIKSAQIQRKSGKSSQEDKNSREERISKDKRIINLQALIRQKENQVKFMKIKYDNMAEEKIELQNQIQILAKNNTKEMSRKGSISKLNMESVNFSNTMKIQNKALKSQIQSLQKQVHELNNVLEGLISQSQVGDHQKIQMQENLKTTKHKNEVLQRRLDAYENQLQEKKMKIAEVLNIIWKYDNADLIEEIDRSIGIQ